MPQVRTAPHQASSGAEWGQDKGLKLRPWSLVPVTDPWGGWAASSVRGTSFQEIRHAANAHCSLHHVCV